MTGTDSNENLHPGARAFVETDPEVLDGIRKSLSQEYVRFMSRMLQEQFAKHGRSVLDSLKKTPT